jgi:hypothetical protein
LTQESISEGKRRGADGRGLHTKKKQVTARSMAKRRSVRDCREGRHTYRRACSRGSKGLSLEQASSVDGDEGGEREELLTMICPEIRLRTRTTFLQHVPATCQGGRLCRSVIPLDGMSRQWTCLPNLFESPATVFASWSSRPKGKICDCCPLLLAIRWLFGHQKKSDSNVLPANGRNPANYATFAVFPQIGGYELN